MPVHTSACSSRCGWRYILLIGVGMTLTAPAIAGDATSTTTNTNSAALTLEELVVTATRLRAPPPVNVVALASVDPAQRTTLTLADALRHADGVTVSSAGGIGRASAAQVRGEAGFRTRLLVDGIELADVSTPQVSPALRHVLAAGDVGGVDVLAGPQAFLHGADAGGVISLRSPGIEAGRTLDMRLEGGAHDRLYGSGRLGWGGAKGAAALSVQRLRSAGFNVREDDRERRDRDGYDHLSVHARGHWQPVTGAAIEAVARHTTATAEFDNCGFPRSDDCRERFQQSAFRLAGAWQSGATAHRLSASTSDVERRNREAGAAGFSARGRLTRASYDLRRRWASAELGAGLAYRRESTADDEREQYGVFAEGHWQAGPGLALSLGGRFDDNADFGRHLSLRVGARHRWLLAGIGALEAHAAWGRGFRAPSLFEVGYNRGPFAFPPATDATLREERSDGVEAGVTWQRDALHADLTLYSQRIDDAIEFDLVGFSGYLQDVGRSRSRGAVLGLTVEPAPHWRVHGNYQYNRATDANGDARIRSPRHSGSVRLDYGSEDLHWRLGGSLRFRARASDQAFGSPVAPLPDQTLVDVFAERLLGRHWLAYVRLNNLFNDRAPDILGFRAPGTGLSVGVRTR